MIDVTFTKTESKTFPLTNEQAKGITEKYIKEVIIGPGCQVLDNGHLRQIIENYHGSDSWNDRKKATPLQIKANEFLQELYKE